MIIYKATNLINGKIYVGKHNTSADDGYLGSGKILKRAINLYGKDNFNRETLEFVNEDNWKEREIYLIAQLSATTNYGNYNILSGGNGGPIMYGKDNPQTGVPRTKEQNEKSSKKMKGKLCGEKNGMYNKTHTPEIKLFLKEHSEQQWKKMSKKEKNKRLKTLKNNAIKFKYMCKYKNKWIDIKDLKCFCEEHNFNYQGCHNGIRLNNKYKNIEFKRIKI